MKGCFSIEDNSVSITMQERKDLALAGFFILLGLRWKFETVQTGQWESIHGFLEEVPVIISEHEHLVEVRKKDFLFQ